MNSAEKLINHLELRREALLPYTNAVNRDLKSLSQNATLKKVASGLYYCPKISRYDELSPGDYELVNGFLKGNSLLLFSWNDYNSLQLGLTQLYNNVVVYNRNHHGEM
jgi:hypothetical protein